jgi:hypothetical protein
MQLSLSILLTGTSWVRVFSFDCVCLNGKWQLADEVTGELVPAAVVGKTIQVFKHSGWFMKQDFLPERIPVNWSPSKPRICKFQINPFQKTAQVIPSAASVLTFLKWKLVYKNRENFCLLKILYLNFCKIGKFIFLQLLLIGLIMVYSSRLEVSYWSAQN